MAQASQYFSKYLTTIYIFLFQELPIQLIICLLVTILCVYFLQFFIYNGYVICDWIFFPSL